MLNVITCEVHMYIMLQNLSLYLKNVSYNVFKYSHHFLDAILNWGSTANKADIYHIGRHQKWQEHIQVIEKHLSAIANIQFR